MRIHLTVRGKKTTVSIDDLLWDYLGAWCVENDPSAHSMAKRQHDGALAAIKRYVTTCEDDLPDKNLSQHLQALIIQLIAAPGLTEIIKARGPRYKREEKKLDAADLKRLAEMT